MKYQNGTLNCSFTLQFASRFRGAHGLSGFGLELTFRLKKEPGQMMPPSWPAELMQELAKYVFRTSKSSVNRTVIYNAWVLCVGDDHYR